MKIFSLYAPLLAITLTLTACGGSSGGSKASSSSNSSASSSSSAVSSASSNPSSESSSAVSSSSVASSSSAGSESPVQTGVFIDSAVIGIGYRTNPSNLEGTTNESGQYDYQDGDTVTFFIGDLTLPPVVAKALVTPLDIADTDDLSHRVVINIARLLQSLDQDGDPSNGIQIPSGAGEVAAAVEFDQPVEDFASDTAIVHLVANSGSNNTSLIDQSQALSHLETSLQNLSLLGSWVATEGDYQVILTFLEGGRFMMANDEDDEDEKGTDGLEYGTYTWGPNGLLTLDIHADTNDQWGFSHGCGEYILSLSNNGNSLTVTEEGEDCDAPNNVEPQFSRIHSAEDSLVGGWSFGYEEDGETVLVVLTILEDGQYMLAEVAPADHGGETGIERGIFSIGEDNILSVEILTDTNGTWGLSHESSGTLVFDSEADLLIFGSEDEDDEGATFSRVAR